MTRKLLLVLLAVAILAPAPAPAAAQHGRFPRKILVAGLGALIAGSVATIYAVSFDNEIGGCSSVGCVVPVTVAGGMLVGYMIGRELDQLYALRYRSAPPMRLRGRELSLAVTPTDVWYDARTVFVPGEEAVELVRADPSLASLGLRARGLRGMGPVAADDAGRTMFVGTPVGLYRFPLGTDEPGTLAHPDEVSALAQSGGRLALGTGPDLVVTRLDDSLTAIGEPAFESARVVDLQWADGLLWVLTEDRLAAYRVTPEGATELGAHEFTGLARRFHVEGGHVAVALSSAGVMVLDVSDPAAPAVVGTWSGARFVYDAVIRDSTVWVAAGPEGLYALALGTDGLTATGLARGIGFAAALAADPDALYLLDRSGARVRRIPFAGQ